jgi:hypothetical protein
MKLLITLFVMLIAATTALGSDGGYLFVTFKGEQSPMTEQIYFGISADGRHWSALNSGEPVLVSTLGEKGVRDPFLIRAHDGKTFYLIATDLSIHLNHDWKRAVTQGSRSIVVWESTDLVKWSAPRLVKVAAEDAGCTWAPEAVYDEAAGDYLVFWASKNARDNFAKHRIWAARTKDFKTFGEPFIYIDHPHDVIDTDIVFDRGTYYRFSKDEQFKAITMEKSAKLEGLWETMADFSLAKMLGYEGPFCFPMTPAAPATPDTPEKPATWCLMLDHYAQGKGYEPFVTTDLASGAFKPSASDFSFPFRFRHGSIVRLSADERERLEKAYAETKAAETPGR